MHAPWLLGAAGFRAGTNITPIRHAPLAQCSPGLRTLDLGDMASSHVEDMRLQLEEARRSEDEARRRREELEIRMLQYNQAIARQQRQHREQALDRWRVDPPQEAHSDGRAQNGSVEKSSAAAEGEQVAEDSSSTQNGTGVDLRNGDSPAIVADVSSGHLGGSSPSTASRKKKKKSSKKKWSKFAVSNPTNSTAAPVPTPDPVQPETNPINIRTPSFGSITNGGSVDLSKDQPSSLDDLLDPLQSAYVTHAQDEVCVLPKPIFVVSDCTGESAAHTVRCALGQFEQFMKASCPANLVIFRFLDCERKAFEVIERAGHENALVVYTLVDNNMVKALRTAAQLHRVTAVDLWGPLLDSMESHLETMRSGIPLGSSKSTRPKLSQDYFKMIEAVEYTRKMDDGANPQQWHKADLLILGVSRSGKTPLSIYLGQRGYKVANLPLVAGIPPPKQLFEIDQRKIVGLVIDPQVLSSIRKSRKTQMGVKDAGADITYAQLKQVRDELAWAQELYGGHPQWPVLDVTFRGVEETAARILRIMSERLGDVHPMWRQTLVL